MKIIVQDWRNATPEKRFKILLKDECLKFDFEFVHVREAMIQKELFNSKDIYLFLHLGPISKDDATQVKTIIDKTRTYAESVKHNLSIIYYSTSPTLISAAEKIGVFVKDTQELTDIIKQQGLKRFLINFHKNQVKPSQAVKDNPHVLKFRELYHSSYKNVLFCIEGFTSNEHDHIQKEVLKLFKKGKNLVGMLESKEIAMRLAASKKMIKTIITYEKLIFQYFKNNHVFANNLLYKKLLALDFKLSSLYLKLKEELKNVSG